MSKWEDELDEPVDLVTIHCTKTALGNLSLPPKVCVMLGKAVHIHFDSGS